MRRLFSLVRHPLSRMQIRFKQARPGSVLIFVVALLVLLALMGTAYISTARLDRFAASSGNNGSDSALELNDALQAAVSEAATMVQNDNVGGAGPSQFTTPSSYSPNTSSTVAINNNGIYLASRVPSLQIGDNAVTSANVATGDPIPVSNTIMQRPAWRFVTRRYDTQYDAIYKGPLNNLQSYFRFDQDMWTGTTNLQPPTGSPPYSAGTIYNWQMVPTNIPISYSGTGNPKLDGQTMVFPAFMRWRLDPTNGFTVPHTTQNYMDGPFIAGDATGWGIADSVGFKLFTSKTGTYYAFIRIVDNCAALNMNVVHDRQYDTDHSIVAATAAPYNNLNFFPCDVDIAGLLTTLNTGPTGVEMAGIDSVRFKSTFSLTNPAGDPPEDDSQTPRTDMAWGSANEALHHQFGRRLNNPMKTWGDSSQSHGRPFDSASNPGNDTGYLGYNGVMAYSPPGPSSYFEKTVLKGLDSAYQKYNSTSGAVIDSWDRAAMNYTPFATDLFTTIPANYVGYWYDWNFNFDGWKTGVQANPAGTNEIYYPIAAATPAPPIPGPLGLNAEGGPFRTLKAISVASNPVLEFPTYIATIGTAGSDPYATTLWSNVYSGTAVQAMTMPSWKAAPHKTSLNTAGFGELWRAFWNVMAAPTTTSREPFGVPGVNTTNTSTTTFDRFTAINMFSNTLRDPIHANSDIITANTGGTGGRGAPFKAGTSANYPRYAFDCYNMLVLRAALAAANVMHFRDSNGISGGVDKLGNYTLTDRYGPVAAPSTMTKLTLSATLTAGLTAQSVDVYVSGIEAQPFITEVYANSNTQPNQASGTDNLKKNPQGYVAVELYNPFDVTIELQDYAFAVVARGTTAAYSTAGLTTYGHSGITATTAANIIQISKQPTSTPAQVTTLGPHAYVVLENFRTNASGNDAKYRPKVMSTATGPFLYVQNLQRVLNTTAAGGSDVGGELVILRPKDTSITMPSPPGTATSITHRLLTSYVPVDAFDFSGFYVTKTTVPGGITTVDTSNLANTNMARGWHYRRTSGNGIGKSWMCVFPGRYRANNSNGQPHMLGTQGTGQALPYAQATTDIWIPVPYSPPSGPSSGAQADPWDSTPPTTAGFAFGQDKTTASDALGTPWKSGLRLNDDLFSRSTKYNVNGAKSKFPYGGFARVGDVMQIPFVGAYQVYFPGGATTQPPKLLEMNPITMDVAFADDGNSNDDAKEQVGRFCPYTEDTATGNNDYLNKGSNPGYYNPNTGTPPSPVWNYRFALKVMDNFTVNSNPQDDYLPNIDPLGWPGTAPTAIQNVVSSTITTANQQTNGSTSVGEQALPVEGLININTAPWQVLARIEWLPRMKFNSAIEAARANATVAKWIVRYRDVDGNPLGNHASSAVTPHGPFQNLLELNEVFDPNVTGAPSNIRNVFAGSSATLGITSPLPTNQTPDETWGQYSVYNPIGPTRNASNIDADWANQTLIVTRVSNLLTLRSDSFTAYVMVQAWNNIGTTTPQLVAQKRTAVLLDRSNSWPTYQTNPISKLTLPN